MSVREQVTEIFCDIMEIDASDLGDEVTPDTVESWDSVRHLNLVLAIEEAFDIELDEDKVDSMLSLDDFVNAVESETT